MNAYLKQVEHLLVEMEMCEPVDGDNEVVMEVTFGNVRYRVWRHTAPEQKLSSRQHEILNLIAKGWSNRGIVFNLGISSGTADEHIGRMFEKLDAQSRANLVALAYEKGLLPLINQR